MNIKKQKNEEEEVDDFLSVNFDKNHTPSKSEVFTGILKRIAAKKLKWVGHLRFHLLKTKVDTEEFIRICTSPFMRRILHRDPSDCICGAMADVGLDSFCEHKEDTDYMEEHRPASLSEKGGLTEKYHIFAGREFQGISIQQCIELLEKKKPEFGLIHYADLAMIDTCYSLGFYRGEYPDEEEKKILSTLLFSIDDIEKRKKYSKSFGIEWNQDLEEVKPLKDIFDVWKEFQTCQIIMAEILLSHKKDEKSMFYEDNCAFDMIKLIIKAAFQYISEF